MSKEARELEQAAIAAHARGQRWFDFWAERGPRVIAAEPYNRQRFKRLRDRLLHLLCCGDDSGQEPIDNEPEPWVVDDEASKPSDSTTAAKLQPGALPGRVDGSFSARRSV